MKHIAGIFGLTILITLLSGCITMQEIKSPQSGSDKEKIARFNYMQNKWSYFCNRWIKGERVHPEYFQRQYNLSEEQAKTEIKEFVNLERSHCGFRRFILSIYINQIRYYVD